MKKPHQSTAFIKMGSDVYGLPSRDSTRIVKTIVLTLQSKYISSIPANYFASFCALKTKNFVFSLPFYD